MKKEYRKLMTISEGEKIITCSTYGGFFYWSLKFPFRHYKKPRYLVATENAIYEIILSD